MTHSQRIVIKVGTSVLTDGTRHLSRQHMLGIVQQAARLHQAGHEVVLVSSGAVAAGRERLDFPDFGRSVPTKQMLAAVGQSRLMQIYSELFDIFQIIVGQVLLTREDLGNRTRFLNARDTLLTLIDQHIVPIINENDTIATHEIRIGDNDNLSALVATLIEADLLILLTDQPGLFTADPRTDKDAQLIERVSHIDAETWALAGGSVTGLGTGGMVTKISGGAVGEPGRGADSHRQRQRPGRDRADCARREHWHALRSAIVAVGEPETLAAAGKNARRGQGGRGRGAQAADGRREPAPGRYHGGD